MRVLLPKFPRQLHFLRLAGACYRAGDRETSREWAGRLTGPWGHTVGAALYYAAAGEVDAMFEALDGAHRQRGGGLIHIQSLPFFEPYRADPRFEALLRRINLA